MSVLRVASRGQAASEARAPAELQGMEDLRAERGVPVGSREAVAVGEGQAGAVVRAVRAAISSSSAAQGAQTATSRARSPAPEVAAAQAVHKPRAIPSAARALALRSAR